MMNVSKPPGLSYEALLQLQTAAAAPSAAISNSAMAGVAYKKKIASPTATATAEPSQPSYLLDYDTLTTTSSTLNSAVVSCSSLALADPCSCDSCGWRCSINRQHCSNIATSSDFREELWNLDLCVGCNQLRCAACMPSGAASMCQECSTGVFRNHVKKAKL